MDLRSYPEGRGATQVRYIQNVEVAFGVTKVLRARLSPTQLAAITTLLPALPGVRWRMMDSKMIAIGGNATTSTSINISGQVTTTKELLVVAVAALTQSAVVRAGAANAVVLADGASFTQQDANVAIVAKSVGGTLTVATFIDITMEYVADPA